MDKKGNTNPFRTREKTPSGDNNQLPAKSLNEIRDENYRSLGLFKSNNPYKRYDNSSYTPEQIKMFENALEERALTRQQLSPDHPWKKIEAKGLTVGKFGEDSEDAYFTNARSGCAGVFDGLGGKEGGYDASHCAADFLKKASDWFMNDVAIQLQKDGESVKSVIDKIKPWLEETYKKVGEGINKYSDNEKMREALEEWLRLEAEGFCDSIRGEFRVYNKGWREPGAVEKVKEVAKYIIKKVLWESFKASPIEIGEFNINSSNSVMKPIEVILSLTIGKLKQRIENLALSFIEENQEKLAAQGKAANNVKSLLRAVTDNLEQQGHMTEEDQKEIEQTVRDLVPGLKKEKVEDIEQSIQTMLELANEAVQQHGRAKNNENRDGWLNASAEERMYNIFDERVDFSKMATTAAIGIITPDGILVLGKVGDSRVYRKNGDMLEQLTLDDDNSEDLNMSWIIQRAIGNLEEFTDSQYEEAAKEAYLIKKVLEEVEKTTFLDVEKAAKEVDVRKLQDTSGSNPEIGNIKTTLQNAVNSRNIVKKSIRRKNV